MRGLKSINYIPICILMVSGCATHDITTQPAESSRSESGSLSNVNSSVDDKVAAIYTRLAAYRHRAAKLLGEGHINVETALAAQSSADKIRSALDTAFIRSDIAQIGRLSQQLHIAELELERK